jgi:hypothetical protein
LDFHGLDVRVGGASSGYFPILEMFIDRDSNWTDRITFYAADLAEGRE